MKHNTHFFFDGKSSEHMEVIKVKIGGGLYSDEIISSKSIREERIKGRDRPYFYGVEYSPLSFSLTVGFNENLSGDKIREILRWLNTDYYKPFYMADSPEKILYAMPINDIDVIHNGIKSGYLELEMRANDTTHLTPFVQSELFQFRNNTGGQVIEFENKGDFDCKPLVHITKVGNGNITIQNLSNNTGDFKFVNIQDTEQLFIDCGNKEIETDGLRHRYDDFSKNFLVFKRGINRLKVTGDCDLKFETEFKIY